MSAGEKAIRHAARDAKEVIELRPGKPKRSGSDHEDRLKEINSDHALVIVGDRTLIIREGLGPDGHFEPRFLQVGAFKQMFSNERVPVGDKDKSVADLWLNWPERRTYEGVTFAPAGAPEGYYNLWTGMALEPAPGDCSLFLDHVRVNICREDRGLFQWVMGWFAHMVQRPHEKVGTALALRGSQGTGKTKVGEVIGSLFRRHYMLVDDPRYVTGQFNAHMAQCILLQADEGFWAGDKHAEGRVKGLVTSSWQFIEKKGVDPIKVPNLVRLLITSNNDWVVPAGPEERRFCVLDVGDAAKQNHEYFAEMDRQLDGGGRAALLKYLLEFDLSSVNLRKIPRTSALDEQVLETMPPVHQWWYDRLMEGAPLAEMAFWPDEAVKRELYHDFCAWADRVGIRRKPPEQHFGREVSKLVPSARTARVSRADGRRPWVWLLPALGECRELFAASYAIAPEWPADE